MRIFNRLMSFYLSFYDKVSDLGLRKKAKLLYIISSFGILMLGIIFAVTMVLRRPLVAVLPLIIGAVLIFAVQFLLKRGAYELSAFLFVTIALIIQTFYILLDFYNNPFDVYRYTFTITVTLMIGGVFFTYKETILIFTVMCFCSIMIFFTVRNCIQLQNPTDSVTVVSTIVCMALFLLFGFVAYSFFSISHILIDIANQQRKNAENERDITAKSFNILSMYTKPSLTASVRSGKDPTKIRPTLETLTILFCDICSFVRLSEHLSAIETTHFLNRYFTVLNEIIIRNGGEIDKLIGDEIMAIFHDVDSAVNAAFDIRHCLREFSIDNVQVDNGVGLYNGDVIMGNIGSDKKLDFTVIGNAVNMASRLESLTRQYKAKIIISQEIYDTIPVETKQRFTRIDNVSIKGIEKPISVYGFFEEAV